MHRVLRSAGLGHWEHQRRNPSGRRIRKPLLITVLVFALWASVGGQAAEADPIYNNPPPPATATAPPQQQQIGLGSHVALVPARVRDTRTGVGGPAGAVPAQGTSSVMVLGRGGVPAGGVTAVVANVTVTGAPQAGYLTVFPNGAERPAASNVNFAAGQTVANLVVIKVGTSGRIDVFNGSSGAAHLIVDITGWIGPGQASSTGGLLSSLVPARIRDTRSGMGGVAAAVPAGGTSSVTVLNLGGVPPRGVTAVVANVTVTGPSRAGYVTVYPNGAARPTASNLNFVTGQTVPNLVVIKVGANGQINVFNGSAGSIHLIVDVTGYFTAPTSAITPTKLADSPAPDRSEPTEVGPAIEIPQALQRGVQPDLGGLDNPGEAGDQLDASGGDERSQTNDTYLVGNWGYLQTPPDPAVGRLYSLNASNQIVGTCSATVVARNLVLTAAHCVNATGYAFAPQQFGTSFPYGVWYATRYSIPTQYFGGANLGADWAYLIFDTANANGHFIGDTTGYFAIYSNPPGGSKYSIGYPSEGYFGGYCQPTSQYSSCYPVFCHSDLTSSNQYHLESADASVSYGGWWSQGFGCYMTGGASGGPVFQQINSQWYLVGVNSHMDFGYTWEAVDCPRAGTCVWYGRNMFAPYLNHVVIDYYNSFRVP